MTFRYYSNWEIILDWICHPIRFVKIRRADPSIGCKLNGWWKRNPYR